MGRSEEWGGVRMEEGGRGEKGKRESTTATHPPTSFSFPSLSLPVFELDQEDSFSSLPPWGSCILMGLLGS